MPGEGAPLGERPAEDELVLDVAQARIAAKLFGVAAEVALGRYRLLEVVGRGGMGVVWGAWDPELERKVAIKLVDPLRSAARERIVAEARALAKLSHPNVVPIYDVGAVDDRVYLVMEWVVGDNLRSHLAGRYTVGEIVDIYAQAARGLAAVHAAGFVHRDFKPENAIIGGDGRVRVLDFGLARADIDARAGEVAGTPRYMAPEQIAGAVPTAAVDQFALCVALREALEARDGDGKAEVPRWLARPIARGTAADPRDRFPTLDDVIRALGRDPARILRRRLLAAGVLALGITAVVLAARRDAATEPCAGISALPSGLSHETRDQIAAQLARLGGFAAAELPALTRTLDEHEAHWRTASQAACLAHARGELTPALYERQLTCLARAQASLMTTADLLGRATAESFPDVRVAAGSLVDPTLCARVDQSLVPPPPPSAEPAVRAASAEIERARLLVTAARPESIAVAVAARRHAEATRYAPVLARALLIEGGARMVTDDPAAAASLNRAMHIAFAGRDDVTAVEAFARLAFVTAVQQQRLIDGGTVIEAITQRLGDEGAFAKLLLLNNLAAADVFTDHRAAARRRLEAAMRDWRPARGEDDYELASIPQNLAQLVDRPADSLALLDRARSEVVRLLGAEHPKVAEIDEAVVMYIGDLGRARATLDAACPRLVHERTQCEYDDGWLADEAGDSAGAASHFRAAVDPTEPLRTTIARGFGAPPTPEAARSLEQLAATATAAKTPWERAAAGADAFIAAARTWQQLGSADDARRCWNRALPLLETIAIPATARRLARVRTELARALPRSDPRRGNLARAAISWYEAVGGYAAAVTELRAISDQSR